MPLRDSFQNDDWEEWDKDSWPEPIPQPILKKDEQQRETEPARITVRCLCCKAPIGTIQTNRNMAFCQRCHKAIFESQQSDIPEDKQSPFLRRTLTWEEYKEMQKAKSER